MMFQNLKSCVHFLIIVTLYYYLTLRSFFHSLTREYRLHFQYHIINSKYPWSYHRLNIFQNIDIMKKSYVCNAIHKSNECENIVLLNILDRRKNDFSMYFHTDDSIIFFRKDRDIYP